MKPLTHTAEGSELSSELVAARHRISRLDLLTDEQHKAQTILHKTNVDLREELLRLKSLNAELREGLVGLLDAYFGLAAVGTERAARMNAAERVARSLLSRTT